MYLFIIRTALNLEALISNLKEQLHFLKIWISAPYFLSRLSLRRAVPISQYLIRTSFLVPAYQVHCYLQSLLPMSAVVYQLGNCSQDPMYKWGHCHLHKKCLAQEVWGAEISLSQSASKSCA